MTGRGKVELNETEKMMIFGLKHDSDDANSCQNHSSGENFANPIEMNKHKSQKLMTPVIMREITRRSDPGDNHGMILGKRARV